MNNLKKYQNQVKANLLISLGMFRKKKSQIQSQLKKY